MQINSNYSMNGVLYETRRKQDNIPQFSTECVVQENENINPYMEEVDFDEKAFDMIGSNAPQDVMDVFEVITFDYISKPITVEKLESVLLKAMQYLHMIKRDFVFQFRKNQFRISCDDIVYFEKKGRQAVIHTISENFKANMTTEEIWKQLDDKVFAHIHVSYIINLGHIRAIDGDEVVMDNEERLLIARSHKQNLKEKHMEFVRRMV